jgi:hypothetical protein
MRSTISSAIVAIVFLLGGYVWGFWASTQLHGDWIIGRTADFGRCEGVDIESGRDLGTWKTQVDRDGYARCHPRGLLWAEAWKGGLF